ncbi:MAG: RluA family pseudouridine synthase [Parcubacteria group bacterium]|nr:RluA family pseudouridine synthase [Parcubacteria group bacterium]
MEIKILYEDENFLALDKPAGLMVHSDGRTEEPTLADWLLEKYPNIREVGEPWVAPNGATIFRPGIVHRLDRDTSGVMVAAKNSAAFAHLKKQFQERLVKKTYRAFAYGIIKNDTGIIAKPIGRSASDFRKWSAEFGARGDLRDAVTEYKVLERGKEATYLEVYPKTGRTHQIRVHLKSIGHSVVCDKLYAPKQAGILGFTRTALHAFSLEVLSPSGKPLRFEAPLPPDFLQAEEELHKTAVHARLNEL